jgi:hypothetical protein
MVLMARKSPILTSWHSTPTKAKILAHSLEVSKKKVTSVSDTMLILFIPVEIGTLMVPSLLFSATLP